MDKAKRLRWAFLMGALSLTIAAIYFPVDADEGVSEAADRKAKIATKSAPTPQIADSSASTTTETEIDPFAPRGWQAPPILVQQQVVATVQVSAPPGPVGPPPLPFRFMGRMNDDGQQVVYLSRGDQAIIARNGDTLEGTYKVLGIEQQRIQFEYLPTGEKQELALTATEN
ncbi:hypothetical protein [Undibacterium terreum]|uniref:Type II secretion system protein GspC N-terminal domain-containing protein n=1 Tax=Undibacterium terreum TaxID=1224302 RepID=A0A916UTL6_9BURK|nr:hypothetical protein [Undibacterium terreum]GGC87189.1 hypothetical protein GCM10011396_38070 [Undibacterium terreum]